MCLRSLRGEGEDGHRRRRPRTLAGIFDLMAPAFLLAMRAGLVQARGSGLVPFFLSAGVPVFRASEQVSGLVRDLLPFCFPGGCCLGWVLSGSAG